ncbi:Alpha/Beta hydrolase protein [Boeremia exigua]|uniref:Alpha/Beta hydrolase protein n=1 Tax=Boeremia exigua TaxID=749465 RepID=UPI001E8D68C2|nr:Alpha/Beta hydrolase protein [Boeremia exigua]KAH6632917.1 Alpha/Beta hydrolase protein [Boeremia exigua]
MSQKMEEKLSASPPPEGVEELIKIIQARDGFDISLRIHRPKSASDQLPLIVYYHLGGCCVGSSAIAIPFCRRLVQRFNAVCVNVDYRLAPEHPFPTPIGDCWDALQWVASNAVELGANPTRGFVVGGESSGGNISREAQQAPELFGYGMTVMYRKSHAADVYSPLFGAFNHPNGHAGLPPAYFQICGLDPVRDEGLLYEKVLREDYGIKIRLDVYPGLPHAFWQVFPAFEKATKAHEDMLNGFAWLLNQNL